MTQYAIYFMQQWVGDHPAEWYQTRVKPSTDVVARHGGGRGAGVRRRSRGGHGPRLQRRRHQRGRWSVTDGPYTEVTEYLGGITIIEVATIEEAKEWAARVAEGCGWPQEVREVK